jgi:hypothetical protein
MTAPHPARIHLLPAQEAPLVVVLRRKPSKCFHVLTWNTFTNALTSGSWFRGQLYPMRCDVSFDGEWLVYLALGSRGETWNGLCRLPWLKTIGEGTNMGTWYGGGYWATPRLLRLNAWDLVSLPATKFPFKTEKYASQWGEDEGVLYPRLERDGWRRAGLRGPEREVTGRRKYTVVCDNDPGWYRRPTRRHPMLRAYYRGYLKHGRTFSFSLDEYPGLLGDDVEWATWDALGQLVLTRKGAIERYALSDFSTGTPGFRASLETLAPP